MKTAPKYLSMLGLALVLTPSIQLQAEEPAKPVAKTENSATALDASFAAIAETIKTARNQASEAVGERDKALAELAASRKQQRETAEKLQATLRQQAETAKQLADTRKALGESNSAKDKFKKEAEGLAKQLEVGNEAYAKLVALRSQMQESLKNLAGIDENLATFRAELASPTSVGKLQTEITELKAASENAGKQLADSKAALETERKEREKLSKQAAETEKQLTAANMRSQQVQKSSRASAARISELEKTQAETVAALKSAKNDLAEAQKMAAKQVAETKEAGKETSASLQKAKEEIEQLKQARNAAEKNAKSASSDLQVARKNGKVLKDALRSSERKVGELESKMKELSNNRAVESSGQPKGDS